MHMKICGAITALPDPMEDIMANNKESEQERLLREKRELLKLKQGLVEDSDIIEVDKPQEIPELHGWKKVENFLYHYKVPLIVGVVASLFIGYMIFDTVTKEKNDLYVLAISTTNASGIYVKQFDIEEALEQYCPDFDGNGYVHVGVNFINISTENGVNQYTDADNYKFSSEVITGDSQLYLTDEGIVKVIAEMANDDELQYFLDLSEEYPDAALYDGMGLQLNTTGFVHAARWQSCPDMVGLYVRGEYKDMTGNTENAKIQRERALEVFNNIATGNVVNPPAED